MKRIRFGLCLSLLVAGGFCALLSAPAGAQDAGVGLSVGGWFCDTCIDYNMIGGDWVGVSGAGHDPGNHFSYSGNVIGKAYLGDIGLSASFNYTATFDTYDPGNYATYPVGTYEYLCGVSGGYAYFYDWMTFIGPHPGDPVSANLQFSINGQVDASGDIDTTGSVTVWVMEGGVLGYDAGSPITYCTPWTLSSQGNINYPFSITISDAYFGGVTKFNVTMEVGVGTPSPLTNESGIGPYAGTGAINLLNTLTLDGVVVTDPENGNAILAEFDGSGNLLAGYESSGYGLSQFTPEPATLSLMALGALAVLRRRKM